MFINYLILAFSSSIDSLGIGITYGLRNITLTKKSKIILFIISTCITFLSVLIGKSLNYFLSKNLTSIIGCILLIFMGSIIIFQVLTPKYKKNSNLLNKNIKNKQEIYKFFIRFLGITIQIIKDPISSDLDCSKQIDIKEAIYLGFTLSIDSFCIGIGSSMLEINSFLFPILVSLFQIFFLQFGHFFATKISNKFNISDNVWNLISGLLLIFIGIYKIFL